MEPRGILEKYFDQTGLFDKEGMLKLPTPDRELWTRIDDSNIDKERYTYSILEELEECESFEEFEANVHVLFDYEHTIDHGTNDFIEGGVEKLEDIPNYKEYLQTQKTYLELAIGVAELFNNNFKKG